ncbi:transmembrane protease serine 9-like [Anopheles moucheti]|uniref:transmembrane protease serine 9-like n=1 Tax=Anopheles moucheti TaxID=186751 RepID=UPI0022F0E81D|nr:transmembrane protease serine 9-like [Anopheles moucheti]
MVILQTLIIAGVYQQFLNYFPTNYTAGNSFEECERRFSVVRTKPKVFESLYKIPVFNGEFQHMAAIGWNRSDGRIDYICGGSLITWKFILTAAHCVVDRYDEKPVTVRFGDTDLSSTDDDEPAQQVAIEQFITHPNYRQSKGYYDIALIELKERVLRNDAINLACIWREPDVPSGLLEAVGFGALQHGDKSSSTLHKVQLRVLDAKTCAKRISSPELRTPQGLRADQMCAHSETMDTCEGDSGGPLQTELYDVFGNAYPLVVGVVSFGPPCTEGSTGVYTRVSSYLDWIEKEVNQSLSYEACTRYSWENRKKNPSIIATVEQNRPYYRVGLLWEKKETDIYQCGGVLIDYQYVLTSADCVTSNRGHPKFVTSARDADRAPVEDVFVHPQFNIGQPYFDIAIIKIRKYANPKESLPICPWNDQLYGKWTQTMLQFGATIPDLNSETSKLRSYIQSTMHEKKRSAHKDLIYVRRKVALVPGLCKVDYGGPVITELYTQEYIVLGILSRVTKGCDSNVVFTSVAHHIKWIKWIMLKSPPKKERKVSKGMNHHSTHHRPEHKSSFSPGLSPRCTLFLYWIALIMCVQTVSTLKL